MKIVENAILSTDLAMYFKKKNSFRELVDNGEFDWQSEEKKERKYGRFGFGSAGLRLHEMVVFVRSAVRDDDDRVRCERDCEAVGGSAQNGQAGRGRVLRSGRPGEAPAQSAAGRE